MTEEFKSYENLEVWKEARKMVSDVYQLTKKFPKEEQYGLTNQLRRSAVSVPSNIAEGMGRNHTKDKIQFYYISRGSLFEAETQIILAFDQNFFTSSELQSMRQQIELCKKLLNGFINYHKNKL